MSLNLTPTQASDNQQLLDGNVKKKHSFLSKSPTFLQRQFSHGPPQRNLSGINPALISNMQFISNNPAMNLNSSLNLTSSTATTTSGMGGGATSSSASSSSSASANAHAQNLTPNVSVKQMFINPFNNKQQDSIIGLANQQVSFSVTYLTGQLTTASTDLPMQSQSRVLNAAGYLVPSMSSRVGSVSGGGSSSSSSQFLSSTLFGVGMYYQLFEMQQVYRHPRKIYEIALNLNSSSVQPTAQNQTRPELSKPPLTSCSSHMSSRQQQQQSHAASNLNPLKGASQPTVATTSATTATTAVNTGTTNHPKPQQSVNINDFYNNYVQPVLIPIHYCCTPLLFYPNWSDQMMTEDQLNFGGKSGGEIVPVSSTHLEDKSVSTSSNPSVAATTTTVATNSNLMWYSKMRQIILIEYSSFFETLGFIRIKEDKNNDMIIKQQGKLRIKN
jgi:hypothetical protein